MAGEFSYNVIPYPSRSFPQTHPDRLATLGTLYGMKPAAVERCRVLELGCGDGSNLISFAYALTESEFVGVDLSERHIAHAKQLVQALSLPNATFFHADVMKINRETFGEFDYIIAHGLYSWVPDFVREKILAIYRECLAPEGVGYISYNAFPGCHIRQMLWEIMDFHVKDIHEPMQKINQALTIVGFLTEASEENSLYQQMLRLEFEEMTEREPENIFHDDLSEFNQPFYFHEFAARAAEHDLQFLSEAEHFSMQMLSYPPPVRRAIEALGSDIIKREQYLDFIKCRRFRQTLVCHKENRLERNIPPEKIKEFYVASPVKPEAEKPSIITPTPEKFVGIKGATVELEHPLTKAALVYLGRIWARPIKFDELMSKAHELLAAENYAVEDARQEEKTTAAILLQTFGSSLVKLHVYAPDFVTEASERPEASRLARWQASHSDTVTTQQGLNLELEDVFVRHLLFLLDGTRDRAALLQELRTKIESGELPGEGQELADKETFLRELPEYLENNLQHLADSALLIS